MKKGRLMMTALFFTQMLRFLKVSPGFARLKMLHEELYPMKKDGQHDFDETFGGGGRGPGDIVATFLELTVGEAIGMTNSRLSGMFPSLAPAASVEGVLFSYPHDSRTWVCKVPAGDGASREHRELVSLANQMLPQYVVFKQPFKDPDSPLSFPKDEMIEYFSSNRDKVNPELYEALTDEKNFNQNIGFTKDIVSNPVRSYSDDTSNTSWGKNNIPQKRILGQESWMNASDRGARHYNPDIVKINSSFTELSARSVSGFSGQEMATKVINTINQNAGSQNSQMQSILQNFEFINKKESLINIQ